MKKIILTLTVAILFVSCKKENNTVQPSANFTFSHNNTEAFRLATTDTTMLISSVSNASSISWDLGDGRKSTDNQLVLSYPKSGIYTVTLTAQASNGKTATVSKKVTVLDRVLKNIIINKVYWNNSDPMYAKAGWPLTDTADVYVKIQQFPNNTLGPVSSLVTLYTSPMIKNVFKSSTNQYNISVSPKVIIDKMLLLNHAYVVSIIAKNANGEYELFSNLWSGSSEGVISDNLVQNLFTVRTSFITSVDLNSDFE